jgi:hypothetical protein
MASNKLLEDHRISRGKIITVSHDTRNTRTISLGNGTCPIGGIYSLGIYHPHCKTFMLC